MARLFLVLENLLLEYCVVYSGYGFGGTVFLKALSGDCDTFGPPMSSFEVFKNSPYS